MQKGGPCALGCMSEIIESLKFCQVVSPIYCPKERRNHYTFLKSSELNIFFICYLFFISCTVCTLSVIDDFLGTYNPAGMLVL